MKILYTTHSHCGIEHLALNTKLYWTQYCLGSTPQTTSVHSLDISPLQETVIIERNNTIFSGVAVYGDTLYWSGRGSVYSAPVNGGGITTELFYISTYGVAESGGMAVVHPDLQPDPEIVYRVPYLLFSTWFTLSSMSVDGSDYSELVDSNSTGLQAVDYHWR